MYDSFYDNPSDLNYSDYDSLVGILVDMARGNPHGHLDEIAAHVYELYENSQLTSQEYASLEDLIDEI